MLTIINNLIDKIPAAVRVVICLAILEVMILVFPKTLALVTLIAGIIEAVRAKNEIEKTTTTTTTTK